MSFGVATRQIFKNFLGQEHIPSRRYIVPTSRMALIVVIFGILNLFFANCLADTVLLNIQAPTSNQTQISFRQKTPFTVKSTSTNIPPKIILDFSDRVTAFSWNQKNLAHTFIKAVHSGRYQNHLRLTFDLKEKGLTSHTQRFFANHSYYYVINLTKPLKQATAKIKPRATATVINARPSPITAPLPSASTAAAPVKSQLEHLGLRNAVVVIDAGHGGKDSGAIGHSGTQEKNVVLGIAKNLYALLQEVPGIQPKLTRTADYFVTLRGRLRLARKDTADLFIAIHADAYEDSTARGASVFSLSQHGATSEAARWLAQQENSSELMGGVDLEGKDYQLRSVLIDLSQNFTIQESLSLGGFVMRSLRSVARLHTGFVEQAPFMVLKSPDIPSILVEVGFLSNRQEEKQLRDPAYEYIVARALRDGIVNYIRAHPPQDTVWAKRA